MAVNPLAMLVQEDNNRINGLLESDIQQNEEISVLKKKYNYLWAMIFGPIPRNLELPPAPLKDRVVSIMGDIDWITGSPTFFLKLKDGSLWRLCQFIFMNLHVRGWKSGDTVVISTNKSFFNTYGPYIIYNSGRNMTTSGKLWYDPEDTYSALK